MGNAKRRDRKDASLRLSPTVAKASRPPAPALVGFDALSCVVTSEELKSRLGGLSRQTNSLSKICEEISKLGALDALSQSDIAAKVAQDADRLKAEFSQLTQSLQTLVENVETWRHAERSTRRHRFEEGARLCQWTLAGSWPEPVIAGIVFFVVDEAKDRATVNGRPIAGLPTADRLLAICHDTLADLEEKRADPATFVASVWKAFLARGGQPGKGIHVFDLVAELTWQRQSKAFARDPRSDLFSGYSISQFRADLTHYLASDAPPARDSKNAYRLEVVGGSFSQDGLFMYFPQTQRLATCGRLTFQPLDPGVQ